MGFHFDILLLFGAVIAEVAVIVGVAYLALRFALRLMRREWNRTESPRR